MQKKLKKIFVSLLILLSGIFTFAQIPNIMWNITRGQTTKMLGSGATLYYALHIDELAPTGDVKGHAYTWTYGSINNKVESTPDTFFQGGFGCKVSLYGDSANQWAGFTISGDWWDWKDLDSTNKTPMSINPNTDYLDFWIKAENYRQFQWSLINNEQSGAQKGTRGNAYVMPTTLSVGGYCIESMQLKNGTWYHFRIPFSAFTAPVYNRGALTSSDWNNIGFLECDLYDAFSSGSCILYFDNVVITRGQAAQRDWDGDGIIDSQDSDADNDGIPNIQDDYSFGESPDTDGDGIPDNEDQDDDNDLFSDYEEENGINLLTNQTFTPTNPKDSNSRPSFNYAVTDTGFPYTQASSAPFNNPAMIITVSIDDCDTPVALERVYTDIVKWFYDRGYKVPFTFFVNSKNTNSKEVLQKLYSAGCELAVHTVTHGIDNQFGVDISSGHYLRYLRFQDQLTVEIHPCKKWLIDNIQGLDKVFGFRSPFLSFNEDTMFALERAGFEYDSSGSLWESPITRGCWPYLMDPDAGGTTMYSWLVRTHKLWEIPTQVIDPNAYYGSTNNSPTDHPEPWPLGQTLLAMNFDGTYAPGTNQVTMKGKTADQIMRNQKANFKALYDKKTRIRAPYHIHLHDIHLTDPAPEGFEGEFDGVRNFLIDILITNRSNFPDVYVLTYHQLIEYTRGKSIAEIVANGPGQSTQDIWAPAPPRNVSLSAQETPPKISISWEDPIPKDADFANVRIYRSQQENMLGELIASNVSGYSYEDTSVVNGVTYYYTLRSADIQGNVSWNTLQYAKFVPGTPPSQSPTVNITAPTAGSQVSGVVQIQATATDDGTITRSYVYVNDTLISSSTHSSASANISCSWNSSTIQNGSVVIKVIVYDNDNLQGTSQINVNVYNLGTDTPPTVTITNPSSDRINVSGNLTITANLSDDNGLNKYEIYVNANKIFEYTFSQPLPKTHTINYVLNTTSYSDGQASIKVKVEDSMSQWTEAIRTVNISNGSGGGGGSTTYTLTVSVNPQNAGTVTKSPDKSSYTAGETVTLTAQPNSGYDFVAWGGDISGTNATLQVVMNSNKTIIAYFNQQGNTQTYNLTVSVHPQGTGTVTISPQKTSYTSGEIVTLNAQANSGYVFVGWGGDATGSNSTTQIVMNSNKIVIAIFDTQPANKPQEPLSDKIVITPNNDNKSDEVNFEVDKNGISLSIEEVKIFDLLGNLIREIRKSPFVWNGKSDNGNWVRSGVYIYQVKEINGQVHIGKILVVR